MRNHAGPSNFQQSSFLVRFPNNHDIAEGEEDDRAYLVVSQKLLVEYARSCRDAAGKTSIPMIISQLTRDGRLERITNQQIKEFKNKYFTKSVERNLRANNEDRDHIPAVLLSERKYALTYDENLTHDLENFPGFAVLVSKRPEDIPYK